MDALGPTGAADLQRKMTEFTLSHAKELCANRPIAVQVRFEGGNMSLMKKWLGKEYSCHAQGPGDLGERMSRAFRESFESSSTKTVIIGTDCPALDPGIMSAAFDGLDNSDLCLGPAKDGGYYLIGLKKASAELFRNIPWGGGEVLQKTLETANELGLNHFLLEELEDVDRPEDIHVWEGRRPKA